VRVALQSGSSLSKLPANYPVSKWSILTKASLDDRGSPAIANELNPERRAFYEFCWCLGAAQSDVANLSAEDVDWQTREVSFCRRKTGTVSIIRFGQELGIAAGLGSCRPGVAVAVESDALNLQPAASAGEFGRRCASHLGCNLGKRGRTAAAFAKWLRALSRRR
jgi:hypothetical protein